MGLWQGETASEALLACHREAGYGENAVWLDEGGELQFAGTDYRELCGDVEDWDIREYTHEHAIEDYINEHMGVDDVVAAGSREVLVSDEMMGCSGEECRLIAEKLGVDLKMVEDTMRAALARFYDEKA